MLPADPSAGFVAVHADHPDIEQDDLPLEFADICSPVGASYAARADAPSAVTSMAIMSAASRLSSMTTTRWHVSVVATSVSGSSGNQP